MQALLAGEVVLVTGAGDGLGRAYAAHAAACGAIVAVNDLEPTSAAATVKLIQDAGGSARSYPGSVADRESVQQIFDRIEADLGPVTGLVNNAGYGYSAAPWREDPALVRRTVEVNLLGSLWCGVRALEAMQREGRGAIVNIGSTVAFGVKERAAYAATKGAVMSLTFAWALDSLSHGIRVNCVAPVAVTAMTPQGFTAADERPLNSDPNRVAPLVSYLLSQRSAPITGQVLRFDGSSLRVVEHPVLSEKEYLSETWTVDDLHKTISDPEFPCEPIGWGRVRVGQLGRA